MHTLLLYYQIRVGYTKPKTFTLTPNRKRIGKAVARNQHITIAREALANPLTKKQIVRSLGKEIALEIRAMSSAAVNSVLQSKNLDHLRKFKWSMLLEELSMHAPVLSTILELATQTRTAQSNTSAVIGMCAALLTSHRNSRMNLIQKITSLILYAGGTSKQLYTHIGYRDLHRLTMLHKECTQLHKDTALVK